MLFGSIKLYAMGIALAAVVMIIGLGYRNYVNLEASVAQLSAEKAAQSAALAVQNNTIDAQARAVGEWSKALSAYQNLVGEWSKVQQQSTEERRRLDAIFTRNDFPTLAGKEPALVERSVNTGSERIGRLLACASGSNDPDCAGGNSLTRKDLLPAITGANLPTHR